MIPLFVHDSFSYFKFDWHTSLVLCDGFVDTYLLSSFLFLLMLN